MFYKKVLKYALKHNKATPDYMVCMQKLTKPIIGNSCDNLCVIVANGKQNNSVIGNVL